MTNTISQGKMLSLVFLIKDMEVLGKPSVTCAGWTFERPCCLTPFLDRKLRGTREIPLKVILGWTSIYTGSIPEEVFRIPNKIT